MLPLLKLLGDNQVHKSAELRAKISDLFSLTEEERRELLPSGTQFTIANRVYWAISYLKNAGLLSYPVKGSYQITAKGSDVLKNPPEKINLKFLSTIPEYKQWKEKGKLTKASPEPAAGLEETISEITPDELLETSFAKLQDVLSIEIIEKIKSCSPEFFEALVVDLLIKMGYGGSRIEAGKVLGKSHDGGVDGLIKEDKLGLDIIYIQAKKWDNTVSVSQVRDFAGSLLSKKARKGILITTATFPKSAYEFIASIEPKIVLIDGEQLAELMIENNLGVTVKKSYEVKKIDIDYFEEV
jgi:restriction system protein